MKFKSFPSKCRIGKLRDLATAIRRLHLTVVLAVAGFALTQTAPAQTDNFNSGTLTGWQTSVSSNYPGSITFVPDAFGGSAVRLKATTSAVTNTPALQNTARVMLLNTNQYYTNNFYIAVDLVDWNSSPDRSTNDSVIGLIAHATNVVLDANVPVGRPDGVIFASRYQSAGGSTTDNGTRGQLQIYAISDGGVPGPLAGAMQGDFTINPGHKYRMVFTGTNQLADPNDPNSSTNFFYAGRVYDLEDLTRPLASVFANEVYYPSFHYLGYYSPDGYSGIFAIGYNTDTPLKPMSCDITIDNFVASENPPPSSVSLPATPYGLAGVPQVVNRSPASYANFYVSSGGITFNATTLSTTNTISPSDIRLFINGLDVTSSLTVMGQATNRSVSFNGLASNAVYDARIELADAIGRKTTNIWTFDTFSDAYLASTAAKNIECEDFDFGGASIEDPIPSGYTFTNTLYFDENVIAYPWPLPINQGASSYVNKTGINARTNAGVGDYNDYDTTRGRSSTVLEGQYRPLGSIGTEQGSGDFVYFKIGFGQSASVTFDTQREKYYSVTNDSHGLQEYNVERTEGGEWIHYTRTFDSTNYYNVYLRAGCELSQQLRLDQIAAGPATNNLGFFYVTNALAKSNYRYSRMLDGSGKLAVVNLSGVNKLRLTVDVPQREKYKQALMLNYLAFVPAMLVESCATVDGTYSIETAASVDPGLRRITLPQSGGTRFYRLRTVGTDRPNITSFNLSGGNVELSYQ
ncbi:MAG: hypothetical protein EXS35_12215 [Pedosphaera sp.]|nr:hypothetical protein [Pedosphaera sp.]